MVFTTPTSLRAGPVDISVLVQDREDGQPVLDSDVSVWLRRDGGRTVGGPATRAVAQNNLLYCTAVHLPEAGQWGIGDTKATLHTSTLPPRLQRGLQGLTPTLATAGMAVWDALAFGLHRRYPVWHTHCMKTAPLTNPRISASLRKLSAAPSGCIAGSASTYAGQQC
jgi:hypothetical protein